MIKVYMVMRQNIYTCVLMRKALMASKRLRLMPCSGPVSTNR